MKYFRFDVDYKTTIDPANLLVEGKLLCMVSYAAAWATKTSIKRTVRLINKIFCSDESLSLVEWITLGCGVYNVYKTPRRLRFVFEAMR